MYIRFYSAPADNPGKISSIIIVAFVAEVVQERFVFEEENRGEMEFWVP